MKIKISRVFISVVFAVVLFSATILFLGLIDNRIKEPSEFVENRTVLTKSDSLYNYEITKEGYVEIILYNAQGKVISVLKKETEQEGRYSGQWNIKKLLQGKSIKGLYLIKFSSGNVSETKKLIVQ